MCQKLRLQNLPINVAEQDWGLVTLYVNFLPFPFPLKESKTSKFVSGSALPLLTSPTNIFASHEIPHTTISIHLRHTQFGQGQPPLSSSRSTILCHKIYLPPLGTFYFLSRISRGWTGAIAILGNQYTIWVETACTGITTGNILCTIMHALQKKM